MAYNSGYWEELESDLRKQLADARAEIAADEARLVAYVARVSGEIERKDKLIEQMREALDATDEYWLDKSAQSKLHNTPIVVKVREAQAALLAAERGE